MEYPQIAEHCRYMSIRPDGKYKAMCDYYGQLDEVHIVVISRNDTFRFGDMHLNEQVKLSGDQFNQKAIDGIIKQLKVYCDE